MFQSHFQLLKSLTNRLLSCSSKRSDFHQHHQLRRSRRHHCCSLINNNLSFLLAAPLLLSRNNNNNGGGGIIFARSMSMMNTNSAGTGGVSSSSPPPQQRFRTWPITSIPFIEPELKKMGLRFPVDRIDGTSSLSTDGGGYLSDALVSVGPSGRGGTGSFVSKDGLILTNWHVAYDAVRQASLLASSSTTSPSSPSTTSTMIDYVRDGYVATDRSKELRAPNYEVWITVSCQDVSERVLNVIHNSNTCDYANDPLGKANAIRDVTQTIAREAQEKLAAAAAASDSSEDKEGSGTRCDVQEMLPDESYVLFTYQRLRDVRICYVPPSSLGNFGGETDNFEWPRHTADFTLLRAYVGKDGSFDSYSPDNVPYQPNSIVPVSTKGASNGDMVFLLGFPGSTMRYAPSSRLQYNVDVAVPEMVNDFTEKIDLIDKHVHLPTTGGTKVSLMLGNARKGLANELKRSKGKLVMMRQLGLVEERTGEEEDLMDWFEENNKNDNNNNNDRTNKPLKILQRLSEIYESLQSDSHKSAALQKCRGIYHGSTLFAVGHVLNEYVNVEKYKKDDERESQYRDRNLPFLLDRLGKRLSDVHVPHEVDLMKGVLKTLQDVSEGSCGSNNNNDNDGVVKGEWNDIHQQISHIFGIDNVANKADYPSFETFVNLSNLRSLNSDSLKSLLLSTATTDDDDDSDTEWLKDDPFVQCANILFETYKADRDKTKALLSERDALLANLLDCRREFEEKEGGEDTKTMFHPDCNGSLRISAGYVEGYEADDIRHTPLTTLAGLFDKASNAKLAVGDSGGTEEGEYSCPERLFNMLSNDDSTADHNGKSIGRYDKPGDVPVCLLYSTDTVGGNSGSPVMDADGRLVAINFDRQRQGLLNEFKWSADYSRSIGVDVRYMLWLIGAYDGADHLVDEMLTSSTELYPTTN